MTRSRKGLPTPKGSGPVAAIEKCAGCAGGAGTGRVNSHIAAAVATAVRIALPATSPLTSVRDVFAGCVALTCRLGDRARGGVRDPFELAREVPRRLPPAIRIFREAFPDQAVEDRR